jgi:hypothetical protein
MGSRSRPAKRRKVPRQHTEEQGNIQPSTLPGAAPTVEVHRPVHNTADGWIEEYPPALFNPWASGIPTFLPSQIVAWSRPPSVWENGSPADCFRSPTLELQRGNRNLPLSTYSQ